MQPLSRVAPHRTGRAPLKASGSLLRKFRELLSEMDVVMTVLANHKGFAAPFCHDLCPRQPFRLTEPVEIRELSDVVNLHVLRSLADLAPPPARSLVISSLGPTAPPGWRSSRTAFFCHQSGMPPYRATSGFLPSPRSTALIILRSGPTLLGPVSGIWEARQPSSSATSDPNSRLCMCIRPCRKAARPVGRFRSLDSRGAWGVDPPVDGAREVGVGQIAGPSCGARYLSIPP
jgi:hypothetical protein